MAVSSWRADRNEKALARLDRALPAIFPQPVLLHAMRQPLTPPTPRRAVESYWRHHPLRADRLARALAAESGAPQGWTWRIGGNKGSGLPTSFRTPPAPYRERDFAKGPGHCCICGRPVYCFGWHRDLWGAGRPNKNASWHTACVAAWQMWTAPRGQLRFLKTLQQRRCRETGRRLLRGAEVDHRVPLFRVWRDHRERPWPDLLVYWGIPNLQVINRPAHVEKCAREADERVGLGREVAFTRPLPNLAAS